MEKLNKIVMKPTLALNRLEEVHSLASQAEKDKTFKPLIFGVYGRY